jgi:hypothetical protein
LLTLLTGIWSLGDIHTKDIEFCRFFAKFIRASRSDGEKPTTQDVVELHKTLLDAVDSAKIKGFANDYTPDILFKSNHQIEYFNIKSLCRALIIIIESPTKQLNSHFEQQSVRLIRTGWTAGLSRAISFQGLTVQSVINENEVVVLLPEAVRFIMDLDEKEEALQVSQSLLSYFCFLYIKQRAVGECPEYSFDFDYHN